MSNSLQQLVISARTYHGVCFAPVSLAGLNILFVYALFAGALYFIGLRKS